MNMPPTAEGATDRQSSRMLDYKIHEQLDSNIDGEIDKVIGQKNFDELEALVDNLSSRFQTGKVQKGRVIRLLDDEVVVDVGYKSEGRINAEEFNGKLPAVGDEVEVLLETLEDATGMIVLSKKKADRIRGWDNIIKNYKEGDTINGLVTRKIRGGLLVDVGVPVFLPASQVDIRRIAEIGIFISQTIECKIIKIDEARRNIVVSRRKLIEEQRDSQKSELFSQLKVGDIRKGIVKNIAEFGVFVDIGGVDGLLHITDMSWGRVGHPSELVKLDQEIEVKILKIDHELERVALGLKQKGGSPWDNIAERYPINERFQGKVVSLTNYGAFVELEGGVEGLVHISQMSWNRRISHPSEVVKPGDIVEVVVIGIDAEKKEISLGIKQAAGDPWESLETKYPTGTVVKGIVRNLTNYGAFVEIEPGIDGLLHVKDITWTKRITVPADLLQKDQELEVKVLGIDRERHRVSLGLKQLEEDPWENVIPEKYPLGSNVTGKVSKLAPFGAFVQLDEELEGLLHISEISDRPLTDPGEILKEGQDVEVTIIKLDRGERRISLSMR
ncbi:MAG: 30S ribosomal protein S1 [Planctomycetota bacterium]